MRECDFASICIALLSSGINVKFKRFTVSPSPSWPAILFPTEKTRPFDVNKREWYVPAEICVIFGIKTKVVRFLLILSPRSSCPSF